MAFRIVLLLGLWMTGTLSRTEKKDGRSLRADDTVAVWTGSNPVAGRYAQSDDAKIYYEVHGRGAPLVLLHSDFYGYIDDFAHYIPELVKHYRVIAIGKRGHGKSEMGNAPFTEKLFADDVLAVLHREKIEKAVVLGFGGGATTAYYLAAHHPQYVEKVVGLAGLLSSDGYRQGVKEDIARLTFKEIDGNSHGFVVRRRRLMPQPQRLEELLDRLKAYWLSGDFVEEAKIREISCPVLVVTGDRDYYQGMDVAIGIKTAIPGARLLVVPGCDRTGLILREKMLKTSVIPFLQP